MHDLLGVRRHRTHVVFLARVYASIVAMIRSVPDEIQRSNRYRAYVAFRLELKTTGFDR